VIIKVPDDKEDRCPSQLIIEIEQIVNDELILIATRPIQGNR
jgi:hypothetical protein